MASDQFGNPYQPPSAGYNQAQQYQPAVMEEKPGGPWSMDYFGAFDMIHRRPDWFVNCMLMFVCMLIPVVGGLVMSGYMYECVEVLHRTRGSYYPKLDFGRFVEYLLRGVGPFLVGLVFATIMVLVMLVGYGIMIAVVVGASAAGGEKNAGAAAGIGALISMVLFFALFMTVSLLGTFVLLPLQLRGGMSSDIGQAFNFNWAMDFVKKTWVEMLLVFLFQLGVGIVAELAIFLTCFVGILVVVGYIFLISAWLQFQLYRVYLSRGGDPIPLKPAPLPMPGM